MSKLNLTVEVKTEVGIFDRNSNYPNVIEVDIPELEPFLKDSQYVGVVVKVGSLEENDTSFKFHKFEDIESISNLLMKNLDKVKKQY